MIRTLAVMLVCLSFLTVKGVYTYAQGDASASINFQSAIQQMQEMQDSATKPALDISSFPENPIPGAALYFDASGSAGIERATISWSINGVRQASGVGMTKFQTIAPLQGKSMTVSVTAVWLNGRSNTIQKVIRPAGVTILWQTNSYTPPFYRGKALNSYLSPVTFIAVPNFINSSGSIIPPSSLVYNWKQNGEALTELSGQGKSSITLPASILLKAYDVEVTVSTVNESMAASGQINLTPIQPYVTLYRANPLLGVEYQQALPQTIGLGSNEVTFRAVPYYFSTLSGKSVLYNWSVNGNNVIGNESNPQELTVRQESNSGGQSSVGVRVENPSSLLQYDEENITIQLSENLLNTGF